MIDVRFARAATGLILSFDDGAYQTECWIEREELERFMAQAQKALARHDEVPA